MAEYIGNFKIKYNAKERSYELYYNNVYYDSFHTKQQALERIELFNMRKKQRERGKNMARKKRTAAKKTVVKVIYKKAPARRRRKKSLLDKIFNLGF